MKLGKVDFCKINKLTSIEIIVFVLLFIGVGIYTSPFFMQKQEMQKAAKIKADNAIFTSKILEEYAQNKNQTASIVAKKVCEELNAITQNPYDKSKDAYTYTINCKACNSVEFDDKTNMVILTSYDKRGDMLARTVIKPPSYVTYSSEDKD